MRPLAPVADDHSIEAALGLCAGLLLKRAGEGLLELLDPSEGPQAIRIVMTIAPCSVNRACFDRERCPPACARGRVQHE
jgi:hypothetical protein